MPLSERAMAGFRGRAAAALVHTFTASGIVCALMATLAGLDGAWERAFAWLGLAFLIDGIDGTFARMVQVKKRLPRFSGEQLDLVVDYVTYVFVPVLLFLKAGIAGGAGGLALAALILLSSLFHFADTGNKSDDNYFVGFPAIWNLLVFYFFALPMPGIVVAVIVLACVALTFVPMRWLHPLRVERLRAVNVAATLAWSAAAAWVVLVAGFPASGLPAIVLAVVGLLGMALTLCRPLAHPGETA